MQSSDKYSLPFKIIVKQIYGMKSKIGSDVRYKQLFMKLEDYIANETANTEREIQQFTEAKLAELNYKREMGAKDYAYLVSLINSVTDQQVTIDCGNNSTNFTNHINNNNRNNNISNTINATTENVVSSTSDNDIVDTPPITPESTPMSIENIYKNISPSATSTTSQSTKLTNVNNKIPQQQQPDNAKKMKEFSAKHSKLIHQQLTTQQATKTYDLDFDDEIFDIDGFNQVASTTSNAQSFATMGNRGQSVKFAAYDDCSSDHDGEFY